MPGILDMMGYIQDQGEQGRKRGLASLVGKAYNAPADQRQQILGTVAARGEPGMAYDAQSHFEKMDDTARQKLGQYALAFDALPDDQKAQVYPQFAAQAQALGIPAPPQWNPAYAPNIQKLAQALGGAGKSSELQTFSAMTAGMTPDEVARARRINLGLDPRAVTGAIKFDTFAGADGRPRPQRNNPSTGGVEIYYDEMGQWVPLGQGGQPRGTAPAPQGAAPSLLAQDGEFAQFTQAANADAAKRGEPPLSQQELLTIYRQMKGGGDVNSADPNVMSAQAGPQGAPAPQAAAGSQLFAPSAPVVPGLGVGRRPEDEAAAKEDATQRVQLGYLPQRGVIEAQNAGMKEGATQAVQVAATGPKKEAELAAETRQKALANLPVVMQNSQQTIAVIDKALSHPGRAMATGMSSKLDPRNFIPGQSGYDFGVVMDQLRGKSFLEAFNTLKGGGQITEVEGKKATDAIARLNTAQSDGEFVQALRELRGIAEMAQQRAMAQAQGRSPVQAPQGGGGNVIRYDAQGNRIQ